VPSLDRRKQDGRFPKKVEEILKKPELRAYFGEKRGV
jgi:hypothetical protein